MRQVGILYVHGIHSKGPGFSRKLHDRVERYLMGGHARSHTLDLPGFVTAQEAYWADVFKPLADRLDTVSLSSHMGWDWLRDEMLTSVAQATGYEDDQGIGAYELVHDRVRTSLLSLQAAIGPDAPLIVVAHSLGTVVMSNYLWDAQQAQAEGLTNNLAGLVTMGSPLALFATRWEGFGKPFSMNGAPWKNLMARNDVIAWPLKNLNDGYHQEVTEDITLPCTWNWRTWSPTAHISYWTSNHVAAIIGDMVKHVWEM